MALPRFDNLFARLLLAQLGLVMVLGLVIFGLFYVERNVTVAVLYADRWAPQLAEAAGLSAAPTAPVAMLRREDAPRGAQRMSLGAPRFAALRLALAERGVPVDDVRLGLVEPEPLVWLHVVPPNRPAVWLGVAGKMVVPEWSRRTVLALAAIALVVGSASWAFTRRLTRPLERLRARIEGHTPGRTGAPASKSAAPASSEILAIDAAYSDLLARWQRHERERAVLLAGVSHDLRSPLGRIRMAAELLPQADGVATRRATIVRNVAQADRLIESFLDYVRSGELAFDETVDLAAVGRSVVASFERPAHELGIEAPASLPWPRANRLLVERLLANLVDNALKHGRLPVRVTVANSDTGATLDIDDAGEGMSPELVDRLQDAFTRGDDSRSTVGSGLGLAIVRQVAARLGGDLIFERGDGVQRVRVSLRRDTRSGGSTRSQNLSSPR